jgi:hypothetical protein
MAMHQLVIYPKLGCSSSPTYVNSEPPLRIGTCHSTIAISGEQHSNERKDNGHQDMVVRLLINHSEHRHRRRGLYQDDAVENEVAIPQAALERDPLSIIQLGRHSALSLSLRSLFDWP